MPLQRLPNKRVSTTKLVKVVKQATTLLSVCLLLVGLLVYRAPISNALVLATSHHPEAYTELYFDNVKTLPARVQPRVKNTFKFHIANHQSDNITYHYRAVLRIAGSTTVLEEGDLFVADGSEVDKSIAYTIPEYKNKALISVELTNIAQVIEFRTES